MIEIKGVTKRFKDKRNMWITALKNVSFHIQKGEVVGLLGENGAGKTTLLRTIAALVAPTEGTVTVLGFDTVKEPNKIKKGSACFLEGKPGCMSA